MLRLGLILSLEILLIILRDVANGALDKVTALLRLCPVIELLVVKACRSRHIVTMEA